MKLENTMKTLLITTLTTALLSFNSFADMTTDIKDMASIIAKEGLQQMNTQLTNTLQGDIKNSLTIAGVPVNIKAPVLLVKAANQNRTQTKASAQAADE